MHALKIWHNTMMAILYVDDQKIYIALKTTLMGYVLVCFIVVSFKVM